jgi:hypothetical protein
MEERKMKLDLSNPDNHAEALAVAGILRNNGYIKRANQIEAMVKARKGKIDVDHPGFKELDRD